MPAEMNPTELAKGRTHHGDYIAFTPPFAEDERQRFIDEGMAERWQFEAAIGNPPCTLIRYPVDREADPQHTRRVHEHADEVVAWLQAIGRQVVVRQAVGEMSGPKSTPFNPRTKALPPQDGKYRVVLRDE